MFRKWSLAVVCVTLVASVAAFTSSPAAPAATKTTKKSATKTKKRVAPVLVTVPQTVAPVTTVKLAATAQEDLDALYAAAKKEGKVVVYSSINPGPIAAVAEAFKKKYPGIDVQAIRLGDNEQIPRAEVELGSKVGTADLLTNASPAWLQTGLAAGRWKVATKSPNLTGRGTYNLKAYAKTPGIYEIGAAVLAFGWNTKLYPKGLTEYTDLLDPGLGGGKIGVIENASAPANDFYNFLEAAFGTRILTGLGAQRPRIYPSTNVIIEALKSGEIYATNWVAPSLIDAAVKAGAPVAYGVSPSKGAYGAKQLAVINAKGTNVNAAELFLDFWMTTEAQVASWPFSSAILPGIPGTIMTNDKIAPVDPAASAGEKLEKARTRWDIIFR